jgi:signal peptidase I
LTRRRRWLLVAVGVLVGLAVVFAAFVLLRYDGYTSPSEAMSPTLQPGDRFLVEDVAGDRIDRGDVVVYRMESVEAVGRVLGLPGEELEATDDGRLVVDGTEVIEPYLSDGMVTTFFDSQPAPVTVGEDELFVLGDNRTDSRDSRVVGGIPFDSLAGRVAWIWWPPSRAGGV